MVLLVDQRPAAPLQLVQSRLVQSHHVKCQLVQSRLVKCRLVRPPLVKHQPVQCLSRPAVTAPRAVNAQTQHAAMSASQLVAVRVTADATPAATVNAGVATARPTATRCFHPDGVPGSVPVAMTGIAGTGRAVAQRYLPAVWIPALAMGAAISITARQ